MEQLQIISSNFPVVGEAALALTSESASVSVSKLTSISVSKSALYDWLARQQPPPRPTHLKQLIKTPPA